MERLTACAELEVLITELHKSINAKKTLDFCYSCFLSLLQHGLRKQAVERAPAPFPSSSISHADTHGRRQPVQGTLVSQGTSTQG